MDPVSTAALALFLLRKGKEAFDEMTEDHTSLTPEQFVSKWTESAIKSTESRERWQRGN